MVEEQGIIPHLGMTVAEIVPQNRRLGVYAFGGDSEMTRFDAQAVILAMGCRERNRGNVGTSGSRPSGIYTADLAQRLVNIEGYIPGQEVVIVGSGDIGLIMARRMSWVGARIKAVVEIQPYPAGLTRNIVQCLNAFDIPLYLNHVVSEIRGKDRVESVVISPRDSSQEPFELACDTVLFSVGLVPDTESLKTREVILSPETGGPLVDSRYMTNVPGIFACGNVLHLHDLVDYVTKEGLRCAASVSEYLQKVSVGTQVSLTAGANLKYIVPGKLVPARNNALYTLASLFPIGEKSRQPPEIG